MTQINFSRLSVILKSTQQLFAEKPERMNQGLLQQRDEKLSWRFRGEWTIEVLLLDRLVS